MHDDDNRTIFERIGGLANAGDRAGAEGIKADFLKIPRSCLFQARDAPPAFKAAVEDREQAGVGILVSLPERFHLIKQKRPTIARRAAENLRFGGVDNARRSIEG